MNQNAKLTMLSAVANDPDKIPFQGRLDSRPILLSLSAESLSRALRMQRLVSS